MGIHIFPRIDPENLSSLLHEAWDASSEGYLLIRKDGFVFPGNDRTRALFEGCYSREDLRARMSFPLASAGEADNWLPDQDGRFQVSVDTGTEGKRWFEVESILISEGQWLVFRSVPSVAGVPAAEAFSTLLEQASEQMQGERRRLSRFLHDTVSQNLVALSFSLSRIQKDQATPAAQLAFEQSLGLLDRCCRDVRLLSYILAPPISDEIGLIPALEWYGGQLQREAGMEVDLAIDPLFVEPSPAAHSLLFAVLQACVARSVRQMKKSRKSISLFRSGDWLVFRYESALEPDRSSLGEREDLLQEFRLIVERLRRIKGTLDVEQTSSAIAVIAAVPLSNPAGNDVVPGIPS